MAKQTFVIMGATGHIGQVLAEELLKKGHKIRALGRNAQKLGELKAKGAEIVSGDFTDRALLTQAFKDARAVFGLIPPDIYADDFEVYRDATGEAIAQAVVKAQVSHLLNLSSMGAHLPSGTGVIKEFHLQEERLNSIPKLNVLHFRPTFFMENLLMHLPTIKSKGAIYSSLKADAPIPMVATRDIALKIAELLSALKFTGSSVFEFIGPKAITMKEATRIVGKAIGKPDLKYAELSEEEAEKALISAGMTHQLAKLFVEMYRAANEGRIKPTQKLTDENKGKTSLEEFSKVFSQLRGSARKAA